MLPVSSSLWPTNNPLHNKPSAPNSPPPSRHRRIAFFAPRNPRDQNRPPPPPRSHASPYNRMSSSDTAEGVRTPRSVKRSVMYSADV